MIHRRNFIIQVTAVGGGIALNPVMGQPAPLAEADALAVALGYKPDAGKVDKAKYPRYAAGQHCANCALFQGKVGDATGGCPLFAGKAVAAKGWCSAWARKA